MCARQPRQESCPRAETPRGLRATPAPRGAGPQGRSHVAGGARTRRPGAITRRERLLLFFNQLITLFIFNPHPRMLLPWFLRKADEREGKTDTSTGRLQRAPAQAPARGHCPPASPSAGPGPGPETAVALQPLALSPSPGQLPSPFLESSLLPQAACRWGWLHAGSGTSRDFREAEVSPGCGGRGPRHHRVQLRSRQKSRPRCHRAVRPLNPEAASFPPGPAPVVPSPLPPSLGESTQLSSRDPSHRGSGPSQ